MVKVPVMVLTTTFLPVDGVGVTLMPTAWLVAERPCAPELAAVLTALMAMKL